MQKTRAFVIMLTVAGNLLAAPPAAKTAPAKVATAQPAPAPAQAPAQTQVNGVTQAAMQAGIIAASGRINQVMNYLTGGSQSGAIPFFPTAQPDKSLFSASLEILPQGGSPIYATTSFAPLPSGGVAAVYDAVQFVPQTCDYVEKNVFKNLKRIGILKSTIVVLDGGPARIFLMPAGTGCVIIKKEVVQ